jgi:hypothetical protein
MTAAVPPGLALIASLTSDGSPILEIPLPRPAAALLRPSPRSTNRSQGLWGTLGLRALSKNVRNRLVARAT